MKNLILFFLLISNLYSQELYPFNKGNLWGYLDTNGKTIIKPQFFVAKEFSEGLAAVRLGGLYGFIDSMGKFVIKPKYHLAMSFYNGVAKVFVDGNQHFIDKSGKKLFDHDYQFIYDFDENERAIVVTKNKKFGLIDKKAKLVVDTMYVNIEPFENGVASVCKGESIYDENKNYFNIDVNGKILDSLETGKTIHKNKEREYYVNKTIIKESSLSGIDYDNFDFYNKVNKDYYFINNVAFVKTDSGCGVVDTNGVWKIQPRKFNYLKNEQYERKGNLIFISGNVKEQDLDTTKFEYYRKTNKRLYNQWVEGFWNTTNNLFVKPIYEKIYYSDRKLILAKSLDSKLYISKNSGNVVWKEEKDYILKYNKDNYNNISIRNPLEYVYKDSLSIKSGTLELLLENHNNNCYEINHEKYESIKLKIFNNSNDVYSLSAWEGNFQVNFEILDAFGNWKETSKSYGSCILSSHALLQNHVFEFTAPKFFGTINTKMRAKLIYQKRTIYSNEIDCSVNPGQFYKYRTWINPWNL